MCSKLGLLPDAADQTAWLLAKGRVGGVAMWIIADHEARPHPAGTTLQVGRAAVIGEFRQRAAKGQGPTRGRAGKRNGAGGAAGMRATRHGNQGGEGEHRAVYTGLERGRRAGWIGMPPGVVSG